MVFLMSLLGIPLFFSCSTAKDAYVESKYNICKEKCTISYSKYENSKLYQCLADCDKNKKLN